jgi:hypothetical protein
VATTQPPTATIELPGAKRAQVCTNPRCGILGCMKIGTWCCAGLAAILLTADTCMPAPALAQSTREDNGPRYESPTIQRLSRAVREKVPGALDEFWARASSPLFEPVEGQKEFSWITFLWRGDATTREVRLGLGDIPTPDPNKWTFRRLGDSDVWFKTDRVPKDVRFSYLLRVNADSLRSDPLNARHFGGRSVAESPSASPQPWITEKAGVPKGRLTRHTVLSLFLQEDRSFGIYTPPGYEPQGNEESLVIVFDGEMYGDAEDALIPTPRILDNLIAARRIPSTVALLVDNMSRRHEIVICGARLLSRSSLP